MLVDLATGCVIAGAGEGTEARLKPGKELSYNYVGLRCGLNVDIARGSGRRHVHNCAISCVSCAEMIVTSLAEFVFQKSKR